MLFLKSRAKRGTATILLRLAGEKFGEVTSI